MANMSGTIYTYNGGWVSGSIGSRNGYVSTASSTSVRTRITFSVAAPSSGYYISSLSITMGLVFNGGGTTTITGYLYTSDPGTSVSGPPSGYIASATSSTITLGASGTPFTLTWNVSNQKWTTAKTLWVWFCTSKSAHIEIWTYKSGNVPTPTYTTTTAILGIVKIWTGSAWKDAIPYIYNGSAWKQAIPYVWNGSAWKQGG